MKTMVRSGALSCLLLAGTCLTAPALAQSAQAHRQPDGNGVDVTYGDFLMSAVEGSIGSGEAELALVRNGVWVGSGYNVNGHQWDRISFTRTPHSGGTFDYSITVGARYESFNGTGSLPSGSSLSGSDNDFDYRTSDGTTIEFTDAGVGGPDMGSNFCTGESGQGWCTLLPTAISQPDGKTVTIGWYVWNDCTGEVGVDFACHFTPRIGSVANSFGYEIHFAYGSDGTYGSGDPPTSWFQRTGATFHNDTVSGNPSQASVSYSYPSTGVTQVTDMGGNVWRFTGTLLGVTGIRRPGAGSDTTTISYSSGPIVSSVTREGVATSYSRSVSGSTATETITDAASHVTTVVSSLTVGRPTSVTDPLSRQTQYQYDSYGRLTRVTAPEGNYVAYTYDARGNVTETRRVAKADSDLDDIVTSATYASSCSDPSCNEPLTTTDERGYVTNYTYSSTHGGVLSVTAPAPSGSGTRPETRYSYTDTDGEYRLTGVSTCASGDATSGCLTTANEASTTIAYDTSGNGNVTSVTRDNGASGLTTVTAATYDPLGNLLTVDGPLSSDTIRYRYNAGRQLVGVAGPDPDGGGSLHNRAQRTTYTNGLPTRVETGTVNSQSDGDWASFSSLEQVDVAYDANARPTRRTLSASSTTYAVSDMSYDALGRPDCAAVRMNSSAWGTTTAACTLQTAGSYGADRITRTSYDYAGQVTRVQTGYGVSGVEADEARIFYTDNGRVYYVLDANDNPTVYRYDGFDRLWITYHANTSGGTTNWSDYEGVNYDAAGNVTLRLDRAGAFTSYSYDHLGRLTAKDLPGSELTVDYTYDLMSRMTSAVTSAQTLSFTFDALGRRLTQVGPQGTVSYAYDTAGRRTQMTYADSGLYLNYDYDVAGGLTKIRENGATSGTGVLATYAYDDRGRRTSLTRGNGAVTSYTYDNADRLTQIAEDFTGGAAYDRHVDYTLDPAGGIASSTSSSDSYAWTGHYAINRSYTANGLNQYTAAGSITPTYDSRGNVTSAGSTTYGYSSENRLISASGGITLTYDPLGRLYQTAGASTTRLGYDGGNVIAEYNSSNTLQRRTVFGPGTDEPLVQYEGADTSTRRYFHADERGSIVATSDGSGAMASVNTYDEYGIPGSSNSGRFQYTGQQWLSDLGMYHYRNRVYSPTLGRFLQTDPTGLGDGMNLYAYVRDDPVNHIDPTGTSCALNTYTIHIWSHGKDLGEDPNGKKYSLVECTGGGDGGSEPIGWPGSNGTDVGAQLILASGEAPPGSSPRQGPPLTRQECTAAVTGIVVSGTIEMGSVAWHVVRNGGTLAAIGDAIIASSTAAVTMRIVGIAVVAGAVVYLADLRSNGAISNAIGRVTGYCR